MLCKTNFISNKYFQLKENPDKLSMYGYGLFDKPNTIVQYLKGGYPEDSTICRTKSRESVVSNRMREMKEILSNLEKSVDSLSKERLAHKLLKSLKDFLAEIADAEPIAFSKSKHDELEEKQKLIETLKDEAAALKKSNATLNDELKDANKKQEIAESLNQLLKSSNDSLKKKVEELRVRLAETKNKLAQIIEVGLSEKVAEELDELFKENQYLRQVISSVNVDLKKFRARERILLSVVKEKGEWTAALETKLEEAQLGEVEVGRRKVKIPVLDLSMLQCSASSDDSEETPHNHPFKSDGNYKKSSIKICQSLNDKE
eukprot:TRINITY_DN6662_c0_g1_i3.p1 TRINITY_DN6662_c0_g1~~TRINITY_DN6662_c0_g1_i3.p1  ORF type:complete len:317 (+),score=120.35 TRINITY_DN6662_c0_g1_i3:1230-2180(+)